MDLEKVFRIYAKRGFKLFPINPRNKKPLIANNLNLATTDIDQLMKWANKWRGCHWAVSLAQSGLVAVDVDVKHGGTDRWKELIKTNEEPSTLKAASKNGGNHYLFKNKSTLMYRGNLNKHFGERSGIDIKHNGYVKVYPSAGYKWVNWKDAITKAPEWLSSLILKPKVDDQEFDDDTVLSYEYVQRLVRELKEYELDYQEWWQSLMAIHSVFPDKDGLALAIELSQGVSYVEGDEDKVKAKWSGFKNDGSSRITIKTLWWLVKDKTGKSIFPTASEDFKAFEEVDEREYKKLQKKEGWIKTEHHFESYNEDFIVDWFNENGVAMFSDGGNSHYLHYRKSDKGLLTKTMTKSAIEARMKPYHFKYYQEMASGKRVLKTQSAWMVWEESKKRKEIENIVFQDPKKVSKNDLNLWDGFHCKESEGMPKHILTMIHSSLCNRINSRTAFLLDWLAHLVQKPFSRTSITPVFISTDQGTGKGLLMDEIMAKILGNYFIMAKASQFADRFNKQLSGKLLTFIDESTWIKNHAEESAMKRFIGSPTINVEEKFGASYTVDNYSRYFIASNKLEAVPIETGNRRYVVLECDNKYANSTEFFDPIVDAIKDTDEIQKFFHYLMNRDISNYNEHKINIDTDGRAAKIATVGAVARFWEDVFFENPLVLFQNSSTSPFLKIADTYDEFKMFCSEVKSFQKELTRRRFWVQTEDLLGLKYKTRINCGGGVVCRGFRTNPNLAMENFCKKLKIKQPSDFDPNEYLGEEDES